MNQFQAIWNEQVIPQAGPLAARVALAILALTVVGVVSRLALSATRRGLSRTRAHANARLLVDRAIEFLSLFVAAVWVLAIFGVQVTAVVAVLGVAGLAVSLALQDLLRNLVAGLYLLVERPFTLGDQIKFKDFTGEVETIELRTTALRTAGGQRVVIPNAMLFSDALVNRSVYGQQLVRLRVTLPLGDRSGEQAMGVVSAALDEVESRVPRSPADTASRTIVLESVSREKITLRVELWSDNTARLAPLAAWAVRERLPEAEIAVLE